jgi:hypothetical protein
MATLFAEQAAPVIGIELLQTLLNDLLRAVEGATALNRNAYAKQMLEQIDSAKHGECQGSCRLKFHAARRADAASFWSSR